MAMNFEPNECVNFIQSTKIGTHENKVIHSMKMFGICPQFFINACIIGMFSLFIFWTWK